MTRKTIYGGNWKMNLDQIQTEDYLQDFVNRTFPLSVEVVLFAPFTSLHLLAKHLKSSSVRIGAQNFYPKDSGAFTGEISLPMLKALGVSYVLVGHSERRQIFREDEDLIRLKVKMALDQGVTPMLCIGETLQEKEANQTKAVLQKQIKAGLQSLSPEEIRKMTFAYEPVWAIGTGRNATEADAAEGIQTVRQTIASLSTIADSEAVSIVYGGSVKPDNIASYRSSPGIDGGLVGGASLKPADFHLLVTRGA